MRGVVKQVALLLFDPLLPFAVRWAEAQELRILSQGQGLTATDLEAARKAGVTCPEKIRWLAVPSVPGPDNFILRYLGRLAGLTSERTAGMSLRYGIFIREEFVGDGGLLVHECVHTGQYERMGGFHPFLRQYLRECLEIGYPDAPMEQEAIIRSFEIVQGAG